MPQAPEELCARWGIGDEEALEQLSTNFIVDRGGFIHPRTSYTPTPDDYSAIDFLCQEYDYGYDPGEVEAPPLPQPTQRKE